MPNDEDDILAGFDKDNSAASSAGGGVPSDASAGSASSGSASSGGNEKVSLDLEGAPFLEDEPPAKADPKPEPAAAPDAAPLEMPTKKGANDAGGAPNNKRKKIIILAGGGVAALALIAAAAFFFLGSDEPEASPPVAEVAQVEAPKVGATQNATAAQGGNATAAQNALPLEPAVAMLAWDPFIVEKKDPDGKIVFLYCKFTASTEDPKLLGEMNAKKIVLRDAIFFYLANKDLQYLSDTSKVDSLKRDLLNVINERLTHGELKDILIENYLVK